MVGARAEDLDRVEQLIGITLPAFWRQRLTAENGFRWDDSVGVTGRVYRALPVRDASDRKRMTRTAQDIAWHTANARESGALPSDAAVIAVQGDRSDSGIAIRGDELLIREGSGEWETLCVGLGDFAPEPDDLPPVPEVLPTFPFHPDPVGTGMLRRSPNTCPVCERARGWEYVTTAYGRESLEHLCPWCIADGSAARRGMSFVDDFPLVGEGVSADVVAQVCDRTPGIAGWQQEVWQVCCADACRYTGPLDLAGVLDLPQAVRDREQLTADRAELVIESGGVVHRFDCRHCGSVRLWIDLP